MGTLTGPGHGVPGISGGGAGLGVGEGEGLGVGLTVGEGVGFGEALAVGEGDGGAPSLLVPQAMRKAMLANAILASTPPMATLGPPWLMA